MNTRRLAVFLIALAFTACPTTNPKKDSKKAAKTAEIHPGQGAESIDFQSFVGRLRAAVKARDMNAIATMMTPDFGYVLGATPAEDKTGAGVFKYWDDNNLWPELDGIISEKFVASQDFMVAPPQFAEPDSHYTGYRAGIRRVNGSWKFVYFVNGG